MIEIQKVPPSHGLLWIRHGYRLILRNPLQAISLSMIFALAMLLAMSVPVGGALLVLIFLPVLMAGYMRICRALEYSENVSPRFIFAGFEKHTSSLVALGGMFLAGMLAVSVVTVLLGGDALYALLTDFQKHQDPKVLMEAIMAPGSTTLNSMLAGMMIIFALMLALQYAPMLVFFDQITPMEAVKLSMLGVLRNIIPQLVYALLMQLLAFVVSVIPFNLGLFILLPIGLTSMYVSYRDIFSETVKNGETKAGSRE